MTGIRVMMGLPPTYQWRERVRNGTLLGPRLVVASNIIDGPNPVSPVFVPVKDAAEARAAVLNAKKEGADFIKVYSLLPRDAYFAIADEAKKQGMPFVGHVPTAVRSFRRRAESVEHITGLVLEASNREEQIRQQCVESTLCRPGTPNPPESSTCAAPSR